MGLTTTSNQRGWWFCIVSKYPTKRPTEPARAAATAARADAWSAPFQKSIQQLFRNGARSQISSASIPPAFMESRLPSRSSILMQSWLHSIMRVFSCSLERRASSVAARAVSACSRVALSLRSSNCATASWESARSARSCSGVSRRGTRSMTQSVPSATPSRVISGEPA